MRRSHRKSEENSSFLLLTLAASAFVEEVSGIPDSPATAATIPTDYPHRCRISMVS
jgi:hypothetical protein